MGPNAAARLQRRMTEHVVSEARTLTKQVKVCVSFDGALDHSDVVVPCLNKAKALGPTLDHIFGGNGRLCR